jgi:hypothetical protein
LVRIDSSPHASFISWLDPPSDPVGQLSMLYLQLDEKSSSPPSFDNLEVLSITNTTVEIQAIMSGEGSLLCDAFNPASTPSSPVSSELLVFGKRQILGESMSLTSSSTMANYLLTGLTPSSSYNIYCSTLSLTSIPIMPTDLMLSSRLSIQTKCCRMGTVRLNQPIVDDLSVVGLALSVDVGSLLSHLDF